MVVVLETAPMIMVLKPEESKILLGSLRGQNYFYDIQLSFISFFHCIDICEMVKKMMDKTMGTWHKSREWRQTVLRVTVFLIGIFTKECP